jgi:hypothetical protein
MPTNVSELHAQKAPSLSQFAAAINNSNLIATVLFCVMGLVITAVVMLRFPNLGAIAAGDAGGDLISLASYLYRLDQAEAAKKIAAALGINPYDG